MAHDLFSVGTPIGQTLAPVIAVYVFLLAGLNWPGDGTIFQLHPVDLVVLLPLSNTLQNPIIGDDSSLAGGMVGTTLLPALHWLVVRILLRIPPFRDGLKESRTFRSRMGCYWSGG